MQAIMQTLWHLSQPPSSWGIATPAHMGNGQEGGNRPSPAQTRTEYRRDEEKKRGEQERQAEEARAKRKAGAGKEAKLSWSEDGEIGQS